jgi:hypothetical protein
MGVPENDPVGVIIGAWKSDYCTLAMNFLFASVILFLKIRLQRLDFIGTLLKEIAPSVSCAPIIPIRYQTVMDVCALPQFGVSPNAF